MPYVNGEYRHAFETTVRPFRPGDFYLGRGQGCPSDRAAITIAGARQGKGSALLIPNALRWPENMLVIDPKGEVAREAWQAIEAKGTPVYVLDPFRVADVPERLRASVNLLDELDPDSPSFRSDVRALADGLIVRHNKDHGEWYDCSVDIIAGLIADAAVHAPPDHRNLTAVRRALLNAVALAASGPPATEKDEAGNLIPAAPDMFTEMANTYGWGGLIRAAGLIGLDAMASNKGLERQALSGAQRQTAWMDDEAFFRLLGSSSCRLSALKKGRAAVFLVVPADDLKECAGFLRVFVRMALKAMTRDLTTAEKKDGAVPRKCLFMLDEFYSLGRMDAISNAAAALPGYGVHLWPFLHSMGQLVELYGQEGAAAFFQNADLHTFFGINDGPTSEYVSRWIGNITIDDIAFPAPTLKSPSRPAPLPPVRIAPMPRIRMGVIDRLFGPEDPNYELYQKATIPPLRSEWIAEDSIPNHRIIEHHQAKAKIEAREKQDIDKFTYESNVYRAEIEQLQRQYNNDVSEYNHARSFVGRPRITPDQVRAFTLKQEGQAVAPLMFAFAAGRNAAIRPEPYFAAPGYQPPREDTKAKAPWDDPKYDDPPPLTEDEKRAMLEKYGEAFKNFRLSDP